MARSRRMKKKSSAAAVRFAAVSGIVLVVIAFGAYLWFQVNQSKLADTDPFSLCFNDRPSGYLAILIDTTDPLSPTQFRIGKQLVEDKIASVAVGTNLSFSTVTPDAQLRERTFLNVCKPSAGEDANRLYQNPQLAQDTYQADFIQPVNRVLDELLSISEAQTSPIIESIYSLASRIPGFVTSRASRELLVLSDLVQHSDDFSFFRGGSWNSFKQKNDERAIGDLFAGATVTVIRVPRKMDRIDIVEDFWVNYFDRLGFARVNVEQITSVGDF